MINEWAEARLKDVPLAGGQGERWFAAELGFPQDGGISPFRGFPKLRDLCVIFERIGKELVDKSCPFRDFLLGELIGPFLKASQNFDIAASASR